MANTNIRQIRLHDATQVAAPFKTKACMITNLKQLTIRDQHINEGHTHRVLDPITIDFHFYINEPSYFPSQNLHDALLMDF